MPLIFETRKTPENREMKEGPTMLLIRKGRFWEPTMLMINKLVSYNMPRCY